MVQRHTLLFPPLQRFLGNPTRTNFSSANLAVVYNAVVEDVVPLDRHAVEYIIVLPSKASNVVEMEVLIVTMERHVVEVVVVPLDQHVVQGVYAFIPQHRNWWKIFPAINPTSVKNSRRSWSEKKSLHQL